MKLSLGMRFALLGLLVLLSACATSGSRNLDAPAPEGSQRIVLWRSPGSERIDVTFRVNGHYVPEAFEQIDTIFRDRRSGEEYRIDPQLIEVIAGLRDRMAMAPDTPIELLSGYRSPSSNAEEGRTNRNVARHSYHMKGMAADIRIPDMNSRTLELVAKTLQKGGVALYPDSGHVHVDTGPVRGWEVKRGLEPGLPSAKERARETRVAPKPGRKPALPRKMDVQPLPSPAERARDLRTRPVASQPAKPVAKPVVKAKPVYSKSKPKMPKAPAKAPAKKPVQKQ